MKTTIKVLLTVISLITHMTAHYLPVSRIKKTSSSPADLSVNAALTNTNTTMQFGNDQNTVYFINLNVGTPPQTMGVQFDTGSNILWLPTQKTGVTPFFNTSKSTTFTNTSNQGSVEYADGTGVSGTFGTDILTIAGTPINITAEFLWATKDTVNFPAGIAGLVGMGYTTTPNFLDIAYQNGQIQSPIFTLQIQTNPQQSYIYYNQIPQSITNSTYFLSVVGNTYWQVNVLGVTVGGIDMTSSSADTAVIDSGTSYFYLNSALFNNIIANFFQNCDNSGLRPQCPCSSTAKWPTFQFMFEGIEAYIQPSQYTQQLSKTNCTYLFGTLSSVGSILLLGDIFFQQYIITFNKLSSQIGFKGNLGSIQNVMPSNSKLYGYISLGVMSFMILFGLGVFCQLDQYTTKHQYFNDQSGLQMTSRNRNIVVVPYKSYRIKQPMLYN